MVKTNRLSNGLRIINKIPNVINRFNSLPLEFVFFVTHRCVCNCSHCFDWPRRESSDKNKELSLDEIEKISKSMGNLALLFLTGGEAFIRDDLYEIADIFYKNTNVYKLQIPSNGWFTEKTIKQMEKMATMCPDMHSSISVSIDGIGEEHDRLRNRKDAFNHASETIKEMHKLAKIHTNIGVNVNLTVSSINQNHVLDTLNYIYNTLNVRNIFLLLTRGTPRDQSVKEVDLDIYKKLRNEVEKIGFKNKKFGYNGFTFSDLITHKDFLKYKCVENVVRTGHSFAPCVAGSLYGVMFANGDVEFCEMKNLKIGNIRDAGYNFKQLWLSEEAMKLKKDIVKSKCACTHECVIACSMLAYHKTLAQIFKSKIKRDTKLLFAGE